MTNDELIQYFANRPLPTGRVNYCSYESTDDLAAMVAGDIERIKLSASGATTSRAALERVRAWLESQTPA